MIEDIISSFFTCIFLTIVKDLVGKKEDSHFTIEQDRTEGIIVFKIWRFGSSLSSFDFPFKVMMRKSTIYYQTFNSDLLMDFDNIDQLFDKCYQYHRITPSENEKALLETLKENIPSCLSGGDVSFEFARQVAKSIQLAPQRLLAQISNDIEKFTRHGNSGECNFYREQCDKHPEFFLFINQLVHCIHPPSNPDLLHFELFESLSNDINNKINFTERCLNDQTLDEEVIIVVGEISKHAFEKFVHDLNQKIDDLFSQMCFIAIEFNRCLIHVPFTI